MNKISVLILIAMLAGCADMEQKKNYARNSEIISLYIDANKPKADAGEIKWSQYYKGVYDAFSKTTFPDKGYHMKVATDYYEKALQLESGAITQEEYDLFKMQKSAIITMEQEQKSADQERERRRNAAIMATERPPIYKLPTPPAYQPPKQTNCTSSVIGNQVHTNCY